MSDVVLHPSVREPYFTIEAEVTTSALLVRVTGSFKDLARGRAALVIRRV